MRYAVNIIINRYGFYQSSIKRRWEYRSGKTCACEQNDWSLRNHAYNITNYKTDTDIIPEISKITIKMLTFHLRKKFEVVILYIR